MMYPLLVAVVLLGQAVAPETGAMRAPNTGGIYVVAHRGVHEGIPENTLAAYRKAIELGADFVEIDLRETCDGRFVSVHNHTLEDYTKDATGEVKAYSLEELRVFDIGSRIGPEWASERIPAFEDILDLCRGHIGIYLDMKQGDVKKAAALVREHDMTGEVLWYVGGTQIRELREYCPECMVMPDPGAERNLDRLLKSVMPKAIASVWKHISASFVQHCHEAGAKVIVDDDGPETWEALLGFGVDGIQTDHVADLIDMLRNRGTRAGNEERP